jgi:hypothetical protein
MESFAAGVLSALSSDALLHPVDNLKCIYQTRGTGLHVSSGSGGGLGGTLRALYRGFPAVVAASPGNGVFYATYETAKRALAGNSKDSRLVTYLFARKGSMHLLRM